MQCMELKLSTHVYFSISITTMDKKWLQELLLLHFSNLQTMQCMELKLCTLVYFSVSMTTMN